MTEVNVRIGTRERIMEPAQLLMPPAMRKDSLALTSVDRPQSGDMARMAAKRFGQDEWIAVCERIRDAAEYVHEIEASRHQQELQAQKIFATMQDEIAAANARALAAERMLQDVQQRATNVVKTLEDKLQAAEDRAREAEDWLTRISEAVRSNLNFS